MLERRSFITGLISLVAAPAIVRAGSLMPVRVVGEPYPPPLSGKAIALMMEQAHLCEPRLCAMRLWITKAEALEMFPEPRAIA